MRKMDAKHEVEILEKSLERHLAWIRQSDTKAQMLVAINLVLISAVVGNAPKADQFSVLGFIYLIVGSALPLWNLHLCFMSMSPQIKGPNASLTFFGNIVKLTEEQYIEEVKKRTQEDYLEDLLKQTYVNAEIANFKYRRIKTAVNLSFWALPIALLAITALFFKWHLPVAH